MKELLRSTIAYRKSGRLGHASLVLFADGQNLRALLKECAKGFFHAEEGSRTARLIDEESYADCLFFPAEGEKPTVEDASRMIEESGLSAVEGGRKLFVVDAFQTASALVQNKLLKALEEPPAGVSFLLGATAEHNVLPTVLSRVEKIAVPPFSDGEIYSALCREFPGREGLKEAASASGGLYGAARTLAEGGTEDFALAIKFLEGAETEAICRKIGERKEKKSFFSALRLTVRDLLCYRTGKEKFVLLPSNGLRTLAKSYPTGVLLEAERFITEAEKEINFNANAGACAYALAQKLIEEKKKWQQSS